MISDAVRRRALDLAADRDAGDAPVLPAFVYDLDDLAAHAARVSAAFAEAGGGVELFYAAKANPDTEILTTLAPHVAGIEVASGGELGHVRQALPAARIAFGGPGKTDRELELALELDVERLHVESAYELARLARIAGGRSIAVLLRANLPLRAAGAVLSMSGPFGMDEAGLTAALDVVAANPNLRLAGVHTHLASGLAATEKLDLDRAILAWVTAWIDAQSLPGNRSERLDVVLGGGMGVDYTDPASRFDWTGYAHGLAELAAENPELQLRIEPGRAITVYDGYYVTDVIDAKTNNGQAYAVLRGGTHHLRTPATKGHSQPCTVIRSGSAHGPAVTSADTTFVGQLCTPKDVLAQGVPVVDLRPGDLVAFELAGAYGWNISHHDFLMHPKPSFHYLSGVR